MLTDFEKFIYNKHLSCSRKNQNKPYTFRKDFSNLDESTIFFIKKLGMFFNKFKQIDIDEFFLAPYRLYSDEKYFDLKFYISPKAVSTFNLYKKQKETIDPDNIESLEYTISSLKFLRTFCKEQDIQLTNYLNFIEQGKSIPAFIEHLQTHKINFYTLMGFTDFNKKMYRYFEEYKFILGNVVENLEVIYNQFIKSKKLKVLVREGLKKIA
jgi:hypothetical protein